METYPRDKNTNIINEEVNSLDLTPPLLPGPAALRFTKHTPEYLIQVMTDYDITPDQLDILAHYVHEYKTKMPKLLSLMDRGYSLDQVEQLLEAREMIIKRMKIIDRQGNESEIETDKISIEALIRLHENFLDVDLKSEDLYGACTDIYGRFPTPYIGTSIDNITDIAKRIGTTSLEETFGRINAVRNFLVKYRMNPNCFDDHESDSEDLEEDNSTERYTEYL